MPPRAEVPQPDDDTHLPSEDTSVAPSAAQDPSSSPTPAWAFTVDQFLAWHNALVAATFCGVLPMLVFAWQIRNNHWLSFREFGTIVLLGHFKLMLVFTILHRFFAHKSFSASRPVTFLLGLISLTGAQRGPLWWGSKHVRHHKFCENDGDPHSALLFGLHYAYIGWTIHPREWLIDWAFVHAPFKTWEMVLCESLTGVVGLGQLWVVYRYLALNAAIGYFWSTLIGVHFTLLFNVILHHDDDGSGGDPPTPMSNGKYKCRGHNNMAALPRLIFDFNGEMDHLDHHYYPRKAYRPTMVCDLPYWCFIWPGEKLGLFYDVNVDGRQLFATKKRH